MNKEEIENIFCLFEVGFKTVKLSYFSRNSEYSIISKFMSTLQNIYFLLIYRAWRVTVVQRQAKLGPSQIWRMSTKFEVKYDATDPCA